MDIIKNDHRDREEERPKSRPQSSKAPLTKSQCPPLSAKVLLANPSLTNGYVSKFPSETFTASCNQINSSINIMIFIITLILYIYIQTSTYIHTFSQCVQSSSKDALAWADLTLAFAANPIFTQSSINSLHAPNHSQTL